MRTFIILCSFFLSTLCLSTLCTAQTGTTGNDIEIRAREVGEALRCVVCQNQSIEESDASLAKDMRLLVRDRMTAGESNAEIIEFMRLRYGDYVLLKPPLQRNTYMLWFLPSLIILLMGIWIWNVARQSGPEDRLPSDVLSQEDQTILDRILDETS